MRVCFILERPLGDPSIPVINGAAANLAGHGISVSEIVLDRDVVDLGDVTVEADLYVSKAGVELQLSLTSILHDLGARLMNAYPAASLLRDKARVTAALIRANVPVPRTCIAGSAREAQARLGGGPIVVKPVRGTCGAGVTVLRDGEALADAPPGPLFAQTFERINDDDLKVYGVGDHVTIVRRRAGASTMTDLEGEICRDSGIERIARDVATLLDLDIYGLDVVETAHGPVVVDVNSCPGMIGVPNAGRLVADHIVATLRAGARANGAATAPQLSISR